MDIASRATTQTWECNIYEAQSTAHSKREPNTKRNTYVTTEELILNICVSWYVRLLFEKPLCSTTVCLYDTGIIINQS